MKSRNIIEANPTSFLEFCSETDMDGFLSDIMSAICEDEYRFEFYHESKYWKQKGNKEKEIFANLFSLECLEDEHKLNFLKKEFPELMEVYKNLEFSVQ